jgi:hypothetical protein
MFVLLTLPLPQLVQRVPLWLTVLVMSRDIGIVVTVAIVNLAVGRRTFPPSIFGKAATATVHDDGGVDAVGQLHQPADAAGRHLRLGVGGADGDLGPALRRVTSSASLARAAHRRLGEPVRAQASPSFCRK